MICHCAAFLAGFLLDLIFGDPPGFPHPVRLIGRGIGFLEKKLNRGEHRVIRGALMVIIVLGCTAGATGAIVIIACRLSPVIGVIAETILTYYALALTSLRRESMKVCGCLKNADLPGGRRAVSMIVGRDTEKLDEAGVARAAVESVAENLSDGVIAPMIFLAIGGPALGFFYKAANTLDSMAGYKNERFALFGKAAARLDDVLNFLPSRLTAVLMIAGCLFAGPDFSFSGAVRIWKRDRRAHSSPNAARPESACAGGLGIRLGGDASYFGKLVKKPYIGDNTRPVEYEDIRRANRLAGVTAVTCEALCLAVMIIIVIFNG